MTTIANRINGTIYLTVYCTNCRAVGIAEGRTRGEVFDELREAGWTNYMRTGTRCPLHPPPIPPKNP